MESIINIINLELGGDRLKKEVELERVINSDINIDEKITQIKSLLKEIALIDGATTIWNNQVKIKTDG